MDYPFAVRRATPADKESVVALARAVHPGDWVIALYDGLMREPAPAGLYVAEQAGQIIGICLREWPTPGEAYLSALRIHPQLQGQGLGSLFLRAQVEQLRGRGADTNVYLLSETSNRRAHRVFQKIGFANRGGWIVAGELPLGALDHPAPHRARRACSDDAPGIAAFRRDQPDVICARDAAWTVHTAHAEDWALPDLFVVAGAGKLDGLMNLTFASRRAVVRRLEGTPGAAADLLACALSEARSRGCAELHVGLPVRCEPLLAPLQLAPAQIEHLFVFCLPAGKPLPTETP
jgi:GNAT superfamily N-acetyltransferase